MLHKIRNLLEEIEKSEQKTAQLLADTDIAFDQLFIDARASTVAGLKKPNFFSFIMEIKDQREAISILKFDVGLAIERDSKRLK